MFSQLNWLKTLEITRTPSFDDSVLKVVGFNCPCLKVLNISRTGISDEGIKSLADNSISLVALDISCTQVRKLSFISTSIVPRKSQSPYCAGVLNLDLNKNRTIK